MSARFLRSKVLTPRLHEDSVVRHRLVSRLRDSSAAVWLLSAPAGYGKTTLVAQAIDGEDARVTWMSVDRADNDPMRFWTHIASGLLGEGDQLDELVDGFDPNDMTRAADEIVATIEAAGEPTILVFDDLHEITNPQISEILGRLVSKPPQNLKVVITARSDPALPIGRLRAHGHLLELRAADLAFTQDEAGAVFANLGADDLAAVVEHTEGWATALRMLALSSSGEAENSVLDSLGAAHGDLGDFLAAEALASLRPELREFLIRTSILDELCPGACDSVVSEPGSLAVLRELDRRQVFTELVDPASSTYRYHRLFRDFLRSRAEELPPEQLTELHRAAARWYAPRDNPSATIRHALAAGDDELALATIKEHYGSFGQAGRMATVNEWLEAYGIERCRADADLRFAAAWVALNIRRYDEVEAWLEEYGGHPPTPIEILQTHSIRSHLARHLGDLDAAIAEGRRGLEVVNDFGDDLSDQSIAYAVLGMALQLDGVHDEELFCQAVKHGELAANDSSAMAGYSGLALAASQDPERLDGADAFADQALAFAPTPLLERFFQPAAALLAKSRVALARGLVAEAGDYAIRAEVVAELGVEPLYLVVVQSQLALVAHAQGHSDEARAYLREAHAALGERTPESLAEVLRQTGNDIRFVKSDGDAPVELSERELAVLRLLPHGLTRKELGEQLFVSENTIKTHLTSLRHKLGVTGRSSEIVERAKQLNLL